MTPLRFGLLGTSYWALNTHGAALARSPHCRLEGVWGRDPAKAGDVAAHLGTKAYPDLDELLGQVDAVAMSVPPDVQAHPGRPCRPGRLPLAAGKALGAGRRPWPGRGRRHRCRRDGGDRLFHRPLPAGRRRLDRASGPGRPVAQRPRAQVRQHLPARQPLRCLAVATPAGRSLGQRPPRGGRPPAHHGPGDLRGGPARRGRQRHRAPPADARHGLRPPALAPALLAPALLARALLALAPLAPASSP